ncbi:BMA-ARP-11, isoform a [Aphelenchoides fujianensis]|nr:BMA-ARP-11, isoform a [Aphelenchoides fujianensis]
MVTTTLNLDESKYLTPRRTASSVGASNAKMTSTVVIEIGTRLTRAGTAEELAPSDVIRTQFVHPSRPWEILPLYDAARDPEEQHRILCTFFKELFMRRMLKQPSVCRVVFVENPFSTDQYRNALVRAMIEHPSLLPSSITFAHAPLMHAIAHNVDTCLLVDTGVTETQLFPIVGRLLLLLDFAATPCSTSTVEARIEELMLEHGRVVEYDGAERTLTAPDLELFKRLRTAEDICHRFCFATTRERGLKLQEHFEDQTAEIETPPPAVKLTFGNEMLLVPGIVREGAAEVVFTHNQDIPSIPQLVASFIDRAAIDTKHMFAENLLFVGGLDQMPGFLARVRAELRCLFANDFDGRLSAITKIAFHQTSEKTLVQPLCSAWLGASISRNFDQAPSTVPNAGVFY